ncbi:MAG: hypothetical protein AAGI71_08900 [Bacteroidota bacterium]
MQPIREPDPRFTCHHTFCRCIPPDFTLGAFVPSHRAEAPRCACGDRADYFQVSLTPQDIARLEACVGLYELASKVDGMLAVMVFLDIERTEAFFVMKGELIQADYLCVQLATGEDGELEVPHLSWQDSDQDPTATSLSLDVRTIRLAYLRMLDDLGDDPWGPAY